MGEIKISIIIPIYNCEDYLEQCLTSVQNQTCIAIEILCIDDGSTDNSVEVIHKLQEADNRIKLFQQSNQGAGKARNLGIQKARGQYLAFLDADDYYLDEDALEQMVTLCNKMRVQTCGSLRKKLDNGVEKIEALFQEMELGSKSEQIINYNDFQLDYDYQSFIFSRELIQKNNIFFPDYRRFQDPPFMVQALYASRQFAVADTYLYCYRMPDMAARFTTAKVKDLLRGLRDNLQFALEHRLEILFQRTLERVEYEYESIIYHNLSSEDLEVLDLLLEINRIARVGLQDEKYVTRTLHRILNVAIGEGLQYEEYLKEWLNSQEKMMLYGAGKYAKAFLKYLNKHNLRDKVVGIVVADRKNNPEILEGIPILSLNDFVNEDVTLLVTVGAIYHKEIEADFKEKGIENYRLLDDVFMSSL